ncbi:hypothetical protein ACFSTC_13170 [Nonomuraea ferruginea]
MTAPTPDAILLDGRVAVVAGGGARGGTGDRRGAGGVRGAGGGVRP